jgi:hypothetical protein
MPTGARELDVAARRSAAPKEDKAAITATLLSVAAMQAHEKAWRDLAQDAPDANPFLHPGCLMPAIRHLGIAPAPVFCVAFQGPPSRQRLVGLLPIRPPRIRVGPRLVRSWTHPFLNLGEPLLHADHGPDALSAMVEALRTGSLAARALLWRDLLPGGRTVQLLRVNANRGRHSIEIKQPRTDAERNATTMTQAHSGIRPTNPCELREAIERFLVLDAEQSPAGPSFLANPGHTAFLRTMSRELSRAGLLQLEERWDGERLLASTIGIGPRDRPVLWRSAVARDMSAQLPRPMVPGALARVDAVISFANAAMDGRLANRLQTGLRRRLETATLQAILKFMPIG